jgi:hypothetical protein
VSTADEQVAAAGGERAGTGGGQQEAAFRDGQVATPADDAEGAVSAPPEDVAAEPALRGDPGVDPAGVDPPAPGDPTPPPAPVTNDSPGSEPDTPPDVGPTGSSDPDDNDRP